MRKINKKIGNGHLIVAEAAKSEVRAMVKKNKLGITIINGHLKIGKETPIVQLKNDLRRILGSREVNKGISAMIWNGNAFKPRKGFVQRI